MVTHTGDIITTSNQTTGFNILKDGFPEKFEMSKPWAAYKKVSRDWGWGDLE